MRFVIIALLAAMLVFYGIHFNLVRNQDALTIAELNDLVDGLQRQNRRFLQEVSRLETRSRVRDYFDTRGINLSPREIKTVTDSVLKVSDKYRISSDLIMGLIETESSFDKNAISDKGAVGLMQVLPSTASDIARDLQIEWEGAHLLQDPGLNIEMGAFYLNQLIERFDDMDMALAAYNMGPNRVARLEELGRATPQKYARRVYGNRQKVESLRYPAFHSQPFAAETEFCE